ncbi:hypothetical protein ACFV0D_40130 [Streptomyces sp. NPDC059556]|uniref:hypothetical protein n=1 Tax=Streptomyces sp. NPDC059556 TaxID=3346863 RepID=UPI0036CA68F5
MRTTSTLRRTATALLTTAALALAPTALATPGHAGSGTPWRGAWAASPQAPAAPLAPNWSQRGFDNHTVRQVVRVTAAGTRARIELSNRYGTRPLRVTGATVARTAEGGAVRAGSVRTLRFDGRASTTIPAGGTLLSDGAPFPVKAFESLTVTLYLAGETGPATFHQFAGATAYRAEGDHRGDLSGSAFTDTSTTSYFLSGVEVTGGRDAARRDGIVAIGDSITHGVGSATDPDNP